MKVMLGLSGGVDSAVAAYLLKKEGYQVICAFMRNWDSLANNDYLGNPNINNSMCPQEKDYLDAIDVVKRLDLELLRVDYIKEYWDDVFSYFLSEYKNGRTPNPDILCNKYIKFGPFLDFAKKNGCDYIAMGHYAKKVVIDGVSHLYKAFDKDKDQTYFLSQISKNQLDSCLFPLGDIKKSEVREIAEKLNLVSVKDKKDSTGICFIGERNFKKFLSNYIPAQKGKIVEINSNKVIGEHNGVYYYTIGQRKGLGIGGIKDMETHGFYVCQKDVKNNILYVSKDTNNLKLYSDECIVNTLNFFGRKVNEGEHLYVKFRYREKDNGVTCYYIDENNLRLKYDQLVKSVTPGQACVFYVGEECLGGGFIDSTYFKGEKIN